MVRLSLEQDIDKRLSEMAFGGGAQEHRECNRSNWKAEVGVSGFAHCC